MYDKHYSDERLVALYDILNAQRRDFAFYTSQLTAPPSRVLDLGCGTGTFAIALAQLGYQVIGADPSPQMIHHAKTKKGADLVTWHVGTVEALRPDEPLDAIVMTGHAFQCLLTGADILSLFQAVRRLLANGGMFLFETRNAALRPWERWTPDHARAPITLPNGDTVRVIHEVQSVMSEVVTFSETYLFESEDQPMTSISRIRFAGRETVLALAKDAGLAADIVYGDWSGAIADDASSPELIFRLRRA